MFENLMVRVVSVALIGALAGCGLPSMFQSKDANTNPPVVGSPEAQQKAADASKENAAVAQEQANQRTQNAKSDADAAQQQADEAAQNAKSNAEAAQQQADQAAQQSHSDSDSHQAQ